MGRGVGVKGFGKGMWMRNMEGVKYEGPVKGRREGNARIGRGARGREMRRRIGRN